MYTLLEESAAKHELTPPPPPLTDSARNVLTGKYEAAVEGFRHASRLQPDKHGHYTCLGKVYLRWGGHESQALEALEESLRLEHTKVAENLAVKAQVAIERAEQVRPAVRVFFSRNTTNSSLPQMKSLG